MSGYSPRHHRACRPRERTSHKCTPRSPLTHVNHSCRGGTSIADCTLLASSFCKSSSEIPCGNRLNSCSRSLRAASLLLPSDLTENEPTCSIRTERIIQNGTSTTRSPLVPDRSYTHGIVEFQVGNTRRRDVTVYLLVHEHGVVDDSSRLKSPPASYAARPCIWPRLRGMQNTEM
jgi:hypothetical protein